MTAFAGTLRTATLAAGMIAMVSPCIPQTELATHKQSPAVARGAAQGSAADSHRRMVGLLEEIRARSAAENSYTGAEFHARERDQLNGLPVDASPARQAGLRLVVGKDELRLGNQGQAIEHLRKAYDLSDPRLVQPAFQLAVA